MVHCKKYVSDLGKQVTSPCASCKITVKMYQIHVLNPELDSVTISLFCILSKYLSNT